MLRPIEDKFLIEPIKEVETTSTEVSREGKDYVILPYREIYAVLG